MEGESQQLPKGGTDDPDNQSFRQSKQQLSLDLSSYRALRMAAKDADLQDPFKYLFKRTIEHSHLQITPPEPKGLPPWALARDANSHFPLITQAEPPFAFVNPATVMPPNAEEAHFSVPPTPLPRLPIVLLSEVTLHGSSVYVHSYGNNQRATGTANTKLPQGIALTVSAQSQAASATQKMAPPPTTTSQKRKKD